ncbi:IPT/TIG domain-containing protein [Bradyrhizobium japonicum]|uniref:IPT/TIG domain-containing protein n=1 Tax=Bradyrhizobium japonicum TaxID=375 RepID=UPI0027145EC0|nr:IPT/TIG domain-containing protein [Bradyrhizobium japonicum]WLB24942.1 IPT/TIG domain-containing protein [Bradyrhizobium japonicum]
MGINYSVPAGQVLTVHGPATVNVGASYEEPVISTPGNPPPAPVLNSLSPATAVSGDPDFVLSCIGSGFDASTTIVFGDYDEPTTLVSDTEVTTIVKPSLFAPADVPVSVRNGPLYSANQTFTFT